jgi:hypothetical protein
MEGLEVRREEMDVPGATYVAAYIRIHFTILNYF